jgi:LCP family protein required for cell wall assembly
MGIDARPMRQKPRTDTMILLMLDQQSQTACTCRPMICGCRSLVLGKCHKINTAYQLGDGAIREAAQLAKDTVSTFVGQPVQYYVRVNFNGFVEMIDYRWCDVVVPKTIHDEQYPTNDYGVQTLHLDEGPQHLDGETALKYVRARNVDDDYCVFRRQQQVIRAVADKVLRADMPPTLLTKLPRLLHTMRSSIDTDMPMAYSWSWQRLSTA